MKNFLKKWKKLPLKPLTIHVSHLANVHFLSPMIICWIWKLSLIALCIVSEIGKRVIKKWSHKNKNAEVRWNLVSPTNVFSFSFSFTADFFTLRKHVPSLSNYIQHRLPFQQLIKFLVTPWLAERGSKTGSSHAQHTLCFLLFLFTMACILLRDSSDPTQNKMTISLIKSKRKSWLHS